MLSDLQAAARRRRQWAAARDVLFAFGCCAILVLIELARVVGWLR